jgi:hypothetical protein
LTKGRVMKPNAAARRVLSGTLTFSYPVVADSDHLIVDRRRDFHNDFHSKWKNLSRVKVTL